MNQKQTDLTTGKQIRHLRTQSGMTQEELAGELNVTRQALSNKLQAIQSKPFPSVQPPNTAHGGKPPAAWLPLHQDVLL